MFVHYSSSSILFDFSLLIIDCELGIQLMKHIALEKKKNFEKSFLFLFIGKSFNVKMKPGQF